MQNIGVLCDTEWDNYILIHNKFKKINSEHYRINALYGKTLEIFNNCASNNYLTVIRHYSDNLSKTIYNLLKICDVWLIFTNQVEYNTQTRLVIEKCEEYNIKYIIISEYSRNEDYYSFQHDKELSFKKNLENITKSENYNISEFDYKEYNDNFNSKSFVSLSITSDIRTKLKESYGSVSQHKKERSIRLLYDKDEIKREKQLKKTIKEITQLDFSKNRLSYYKNLK
uniref:Uncharacterized protein n=1 Tax=viral metagenome TaxID=1070528 RepID=A0A6C0LH18_9ZZZZ